MRQNRRLKAARVLRGMTQLQLAERIGLKEIDLSRFETGRSCPCPETRKHIAEVLDISVEELFES